MRTPEKSLHSVSSYATLALLLAVAAGIMVAGSRFARHEETARVVVDRGLLNAVAGGMERELGRLERLYENHLRQIVVATRNRTADHQSIWQASDPVVGVIQWSVIHRDQKVAPDNHVVVDLKQAGRIPEPAFDGWQGLPRPKVLLLSGDILQPDGAGWGWVDEPGKPLLFWQQAGPESAIVLTIDQEQLHTALSPWFAQWAAGNFGPLRAAGNPVALLGRDGKFIASAGVEEKSPADFLLPLRSRFGDWQFAAWDRLETRVTYDMRTQAVAGTLAVLLALMAVFVFVQQRRMLALAAQRVSFVNSVSHELRTPLTNMMLNLDLAADALAGAPPEPMRRFSLVREEARRLGRLIENALTFSRKQRGRLKVELRACVPAGVIELAVEQFAPSFARRALHVHCTGNISTACLLDIDAFAQILSNLLSNVEKYVPGGEVEILSRMEAGLLIVSVSDQGPGISAHNAARIFKPFERLDGSINEGASGTGLGLAIARDLAIALGGSLNLIPSVLGATFELRIPAPPAPGISIISAA